MTMITFDLIKNHANLGKVKTVLEIGTGNGNLAYEVLNYLFSNGIKAKYHGFDLFEKINTSIPGITEVDENNIVQSTDVRKRLSTVCDIRNINLYVGDSAETLAGFTNTNTDTLDLVIINGSQLHQNLLKDFYLTNPFYSNGTAVFFDYYDGDAKQIVDDLDYFDLTVINDSVAMITWKVDEANPMYTEENYVGPHNRVV